MKTYTYSEARQRLASLLDQACRDGQVQIRRQDGSTFVLQPVVAERSPLDVPGVRSRLRRGELVRLVREERARGEERVTAALADQGAPPVPDAKRRPRRRRRGSRQKG